MPEVLVRYARQLVREHGVDDDDQLTERFSHRLRTTASDLNKEREKEARKNKPDKVTGKDPGKKKRGSKDVETSESEDFESKEDEVDIFDKSTEEEEDDDDEDDSLLSATDREQVKYAFLLRF